MFNFSLLSSDSYKISLKIRLKKHRIKAVPSRIIWRRPLWSANLIAQRFRAPEGGYILSSLREERLGEKGGAFFNGKEGRDDFRKMPSLTVRKDE